MVEMQGKLSGLLLPDMLRDLVNVLHQSHRISEGVSIDVLHQEGLGIALRQQKIDLIGAVDVAHLDGLITEILVIDAEQPAHFQQFLIQIHEGLLSDFFSGERLGLRRKDAA